jgi:hypothetical protein
MKSSKTTQKPSSGRFPAGVLTAQQLSERNRL